ncbi:MAG: shikimate kinase [Verrucomicrobia bacterium]|nr:shikimate kinase [Verrucomicrobiota bacterium]MDA1088543.1 shikimate kinase [Verrucomicrobiota bacterium]
MKIILCGYRASGKTTVGKLVAERLGWPYQDVDRGIDERSGMTIAEFLAADLERYRQVETEVVIEMCGRNETVIALGGGSLMRASNQQAVGEESLVVYLQASVDELWRRAEADPISAATRPQLAGGGIEEIEQLLTEREPVYLECSDLVLDATLPPQELADFVISEYHLP